MPIKKSKGVTETERLLAELCERSFLKLWSYPNPIREDKDELCDLIAVFENHVFIFFDRESKRFENSGKDPMTTWSRWKRSAIDAQVRTAHGAERYIRQGRCIFLDTDLKQPFPIEINRSEMTVHKIVVAHGAKEACQNFSNANVYGSLAISYGHVDGVDFPFMVRVDKGRPVHIFDSHNLPIILGELDTIFDFASYLDAKIDAINRLDGLMYCGEEDLLAHYFLNYVKKKNRHVIGPTRGDFNCCMIGEGEWKDFIELDAYKAKKNADKVSYFWDELIQRTCQNELDGSLLGDSILSEGRSAIHEMAKEPRFSRRALSEAMIGAIRNFPDSSEPMMRNLSFMPSFYKDKAYILLQTKIKSDTHGEDECREVRRGMLEVACGVAKNRFPKLDTVVGIAMEAPKFSESVAEDLLLLNCENWDEKTRKHYEDANKVMGFFNSETLTRNKKRVREFPKSQRVNDQGQRRKVGRNTPCPCGSGKKYKKCCWNNYL